MYKALFFDLDDTIFDFSECSKNALKKTCAQLDRDFSENLYEQFRDIDQNLWREQKSGLLTVGLVKELRARQVAKVLGCAEKWPLFQAGFQKNLGLEAALVRHAAEALTLAYQRGYLLFAASNGNLQIQKNRLSLSGIDSLFEDVFVSDNIGYEKPDPKFFLECLRRCGLQKRDILMIGDSYEADILGAGRCGIDSCWFTHGRTDRMGHSAPAYVISDLLQLDTFL